MPRAERACSAHFLNQKKVSQLKSTFCLINGIHAIVTWLISRAIPCRADWVTFHLGFPLKRFVDFLECRLAVAFKLHRNRAYRPKSVKVMIGFVSSCKVIASIR